MKLMDLLTSAANGDGVGSLARQFSVSSDQVLGVAQAALPAFSSGLKRLTQSPDGLTQLAGLLRSNDAADVADAPEANADALAAQGGGFMDALFGAARPEIEREVAQKGAERSGLDLSVVTSMLPMMASMILGMFQKTESNDGALGGLVSSMLAGGAASGDGASSGGLAGMISGAASLLGGGQSDGQSGAFGMDQLTAMFDADGDGSVTDDLLDRFMKS